MPATCDAPPPPPNEHFPTDVHDLSRRVLVLCGQQRVYMHLNQFSGNDTRRLRRPTPMFSRIGRDARPKKMTAAATLMLCDPDAYRMETGKGLCKRRAFTSYMRVYFNDKWRGLYTSLADIRKAAASASPSSTRKTYIKGKKSSGGAQEDLVEEEEAVSPKGECDEFWGFDSQELVNFDVVDGWRNTLSFKESTYGTSEL